MTSTAEAAAPTRANASLTVALCFCVMVIEGFDIQAMGVAAPALGPELKLSREVLGQALSASNIGLVFGAIVGGWLADVFGRKPVLVAATAIFGLFTLMTMQATSFEMLFAARLLTGLGFGGALPNVMAVAADVSRSDRRGSTAAMMFCGMPVGRIVSRPAELAWLSGRMAAAVLDRRDHSAGSGAAADLPDEGDAEACAWRGVDRSDALPWLVGNRRLAWRSGTGSTSSGRMPGAGSVGGVVAPWLGGVLGLLGAYLIVHRGPLFGGGRSPISLLLWLTFVPTLLILYLVLNWLPTLVAAKGFHGRRQPRVGAVQRVQRGGCADPRAAGRPVWSALAADAWASSR